VQPFLDKHVCLKSCGSDSSPDIRYPDDADELLAGLGDGTIIDDWDGKVSLWGGEAGHLGIMSEAQTVLV